MLSSNLIRLSTGWRVRQPDSISRDETLASAVLEENIRSSNKKGSAKLVSELDCNFAKYVDVFRKLLLLNERNNLSQALKNIQELLSFSENIFTSSAVAEAFLYFCLHGAATGWILQTELNMPEATVYRTIKRLRALSVIEPAIKVSKIRNSKGGPRPTVWALHGASADEISEALSLHFKKLSPKYRIAEEVAQTILDKYMVRKKSNEISYREIVIHIKELNIPFKTPDIADLAAEYLSGNGIKVWR